MFRDRLHTSDETKQKEISVITRHEPACCRWDAFLACTDADATFGVLLIVVSFMALVGVLITCKSLHSKVHEVPLHGETSE
jgi:hypothetical protein